MILKLYYRGQIYNQLFKSQGKPRDVHTRLMKVYPQVSAFVYGFCLLLMTVVAVATVTQWSDEFQLEWWGIILAVGFTALFIIPVGIIRAISSTSITLNVLSQMVIGYFQPGALANLTFKVFGTNTLAQSLDLVSDLKLAHYMKIPPRSMFFCQLYGTLVAAVTNYAAFRFVLQTFPDILAHACRVAGGKDCPSIQETQWMSPKPGIVYTASLLWGVVGPVRMFFEPDSPYRLLLWFFLGGVVLTCLVYFLHRWFPNVGFNYVNIPIILQSSSYSLMGYGNAIVSATVVGYVSQVYIRKHYRTFYDRYNYIISAALDSATVAASILLLIFTFLIPQVILFYVDAIQGRDADFQDLGT